MRKLVLDFVFVVSVFVFGSQVHENVGLRAAFVWRAIFSL